VYFNRASTIAPQYFLGLAAKLNGAVDPAKLCIPNKTGGFRTGIFFFPGISKRRTCAFPPKTMESVQKGVINAQEACFQRACDDVINHL
jgi:hypothetical protein